MYNNILVAIAPDHGEDQSKALDVAQTLASEGATVTAVTAIEPIATYIAASIPEGFEKAAGEEALKGLRQLIGDREGVDARVTYASAAGAILDLSKELEADCIVLASHKPGWGHILLGSTAARVVRHARCSVHVIR